MLNPSPRRPLRRGLVVKQKFYKSCRRCKRKLEGTEDKLKPADDGNVVDESCREFTRQRAVHSFDIGENLSVNTRERTFGLY